MESKDLPKLESCCPSSLSKVVDIVGPKQQLIHLSNYIPYNISILSNF